MEKRLESKNSEIQAKNAEITKLKNELEFLKSQILNKNKKMFGKSSEQVDSNQMSLFDEAEKNSDNKIAEPTVLEVTYTRKKNKESNGKKDNLAQLEKVVIEHKLTDGETICSNCNENLVVIGKKSKEVLKYIPAKLYVEEHVTYSYACKSCEIESGKANIISVKAPSNLINKGMASNELLAHVIIMKYLHDLPLYR